MTKAFDRRDAWMPAEAPFESTGVGRPASRPNIVIVLADDLGAGDLGCYGSLSIQTPRLDRLAAEGLRFTDGYSTAPTCSPTRIALYTGRYPHRLLVGMEEPLGTRDEHHGIPHDHPTLPSLLKNAGYATAMFGKWHCGWLPWFSPVKAGFETFFGNLDGAMDYFSHIDTAGLPDLYEGEVAVDEVGYYTDLITDRAVDFFNASTDDKPFYLQVNYTAPHWPWEGPGDQDVSDRVTAAMHIDPLTALFNFDGGSLAKYAELVEVLDESVGRLMQALESRRISENTIVVFMSDNGGERFSFMWPFVGEKGDLEEGGVRVPFILRWPCAIRPGQVTGLAAGTMDVTATALDAAGVAPHPDYPLDGTSLLGWLVDNEPPPQRDLLWRTQEQGAIRRGDFKLLIDRQAKPLWFRHFAKEGDRIRLSNLVDDARERKDLSGEHVALVASMLDAWRAFDSEMLPYEPEQALATTRTKANVNPSPLVPGRPD